MDRRLLVAVSALAAGLAALALLLAGATGFSLFPDTAAVVRVIDGDTLVLEGGERVRLLGIDTPEYGQVLSENATALLTSLALNRGVRLERDQEDRDKYGRLLRHVFIGDLHVNAELLKAGWASTLIVPPNVQRTGELLRAQGEARNASRGIWSLPHPWVLCFHVDDVHANARGDDRLNLTDEYIVFRNKCYQAISIAGWRVRDNRGTTYTFQRTLDARKTVALRTGAGTDTETDAFWGLDFPVWNNGGDTVFAETAGGEPVLEYSYPRPRS